MLDFRYGILSKFGFSQDPLSASVSVLQQFGIQHEMYQVGYTKLYFRAGQVSPVYQLDTSNVIFTGDGLCISMIMYN